MKNKLLNIVSWGMMAVGLGSAAVGTIPVLQELIPQFTTQMAIWTGIPATTMGAIGMGVQSYITNVRKTDLTINEGVVNGMTKVFNKVDEITSKQEKIIRELSVKYERLEGKYDDLKEELKTANQSMQTLIKLTRIDLEAKLSNPLIDAKVKEMIEGVMDEV